MARQISVSTDPPAERMRLTPDETPVVPVTGLDAFLELSPDVVVVVDHRGTIVRANDEIRGVLGYDPRELVGKPIEVLVPAGSRSVHAAQREAFLAAPSRRPMGAGRDLFARHRDGRRVPVDISLAPLPSDGERLVAAVVRDVTERHEAEASLRSWAELFEQAGFGIVVSEGAGDRIAQANSAVAAMHGYTPDELVGRPIADLFAPEERSRMPERIARAHAHGRYRDEAMHVRADGTRFPAIADVTVVTDDRGEILYRAAYIQDITEQRETERQLHAWQRRFEASVEAMPDAVLFLGCIRQDDGIADFEIVYANGSFAAAVGADPEALRGASLRDRFPGHGRAGLFDEYAAVATSGQPRRVHLTDDPAAGLRGSFDVEIAQLEDGVVVVFHDVTERQAVQEELYRTNVALEEANAHLQGMNHRLEVANRHQEMFVSTASHELRTPLTTIRGFAETLDRYWDALDDQRRRHYLDAIQRSVERQTTLLSDLLDAARIRAGRLDLRLVPVPVARVVEAAVEAAAVHGPVLQVDLQPDLQVVADEVRLVQVLVNLVTNASKYGAPPIELTARPADGHVELIVRDHGDGIPADFEPSLFEMFAQASRGDQRTATGTGLGLFIVRQLTDAMQGRVEHRRPDDGGAAFVVRLPAA